MNIGKLRKPVDRFAPALGRIYRALRDSAAARRPSTPTKFGFTMATMVGSPQKAAMAGLSWDVNEIIFFIEMFQNHNIVIDIGANVGFYTCLAASRGKHVICIEPSRKNQDYLYRNLWENRFLDVEVLPLGLSEKCGLARLYGYNTGASFVPGWESWQESHYSLVPLTTLDAIVSTRFQGENLLIKIDVEGLELEVLKGAMVTIGRSPKPAWMVEIQLSGESVPGGFNTRFYECFDLFWKRGYKCRRTNSERSLVISSDVMRWVANRQVDDNGINFLFTDF